MGMRMHYRYGWPFGRFLAKAGVPTKIQVNVIFDDEAGVFVGTSTDVCGLVVEAATLEEVIREARSLIPDLVCEPSSLGSDTIADVRFKERLVHA